MFPSVYAVSIVGRLLDALHYTVNKFPTGRCGRQILAYTEETEIQLLTVRIFQGRNLSLCMQGLKLRGLLRVVSVSVHYLEAKLNLAYITAIRH